MVEISPYNACSDITNKEELQDRIAIAQRGGCMFIDKVAYILLLYLTNNIKLSILPTFNSSPTCTIV